MTYFPPLQDRYQPELAQYLRHLINPIAPFDAKLGEPRWYGPDEDIRGLPVESHPRLIEVHHALVTALHYLTHDARYRTPYNPHISIPEANNRLKPGDKIPMAGLSIVELSLERQTWKVMDKIGLKGEIS